VPACQFARRLGLVAARNCVGARGSGHCTQVLVCGPLPDLVHGGLCPDGMAGIDCCEALLQAVPTIGLIWLLAGGLMYTVGVAFYAWNRIPYNHVIWHLFVMAGSACHYFAVVYSVIPRART